MPDASDTTDSRRRLILLMSLLIFSNISCFTIISSFTKSNFLTAIETIGSFKQVYNQAPYFILYFFSSVFFIIYSVIYYAVAKKVSFERRVKAEMLALMACSLSLIVISTIFPNYVGRFLPAAFCFVVMDIFDELILLQTWTLINYCIDIRESKKYQYLFLFSGSIGALISGYYIIGKIPDDKPFVFRVLGGSINFCLYESFKQCA